MLRKTSVVYLEIPRSLRRRLEREAKASGRTLSAVVRTAISVELEHCEAVRASRVEVQP